MKITSQLISLILIAGLSAPAVAARISKDDYNAAKARAEADLKIEKQKCDSLAGNAKDICMAQAEGAYDVAKAQAEAQYKGEESDFYDARKAKIDADYKVAKERCDDFSGNKKDVCLKEAKAAKVKHEEDAKLNRKQHEAAGGNQSAMKNARHQANNATRDAEYKVEKEKCDQYSGDAKDQCIARAKSLYQK